MGTSYYIDNVFVKYAYIVNEVFNNIMFGTQPWDWQIGGAHNTSCLIVNTPSDLDGSLMFKDYSTEGYTQASKIFSDLSDRVVVQWKFMNDFTGDWPYFSIRNGAIPVIDIHRVGSNLVYRNDTGKDITIQSVSADV